ncbi:hypothetical protein PVT68_16705 [Microbulbifer bruguierae]|uniref:Sulfotransferase family protein n=1 Tax=Microbulbifer bruguierae TaxID=3029061 RepID=A0ABY8NCR4_9GAMM|nr:sulfotransferase [Microbulbifer bruguierae]WGL16392.1 hypothetical protein PVT68_16705 [Microbulbifer bruguierae]
MSDGKIFVIGMNATGTSILHRAFQVMGLNSLHWAPEVGSLKSRMEEAKKFQFSLLNAIEAGKRDPLGDASYFDVFSDVWPIIQYFEYFYSAYPGSKFIYTCRDDEEWLRDRERHVGRNKSALESGDYVGSFVNVEREKWLKEKYNHLKRVKQWFSADGRSDDLLYFDLYKGDGFVELCDFLDCKLPERIFPLFGKVA